MAQLIRAWSWFVVAVATAGHARPAIAEQSADAPAATSWTPDAVPACRCVSPARVAKTHRVELSFGSAELFTRQSVTDPTGIIHERVIPITALNVFGEYLLHPRLSVLVQFLLPLEPESTLVDGQLSLRYVPPALSGGFLINVVGVPVTDETTLEAHLFLLGGSTLDRLSNDRFYPTLGWRAQLRDDGGFTMYIGTSFAFRQNTTALLYGVGHRF